MTMITNPFKLYPAATCWNWLAFIVVTLVWFAFLEQKGLRREGGYIPLTWFIRDTVPQLARWMIACWLLYHFGVITNTNQPLH